MKKIKNVCKIRCSGVMHYAATARNALSVYIITVLSIFFSIQLSAQTDWPIFRGDYELTASSNEQIPDKPALLFSFETADDIKASPVVKDGIIYCGSTDGNFYAFDFEGNIKWKFTAQNSIEAPAILIDESVIFGTLDGDLLCLNSQTGDSVWGYKTDNQIIGSANWIKTNGQNIAAVGSYDYYLHGIDIETGKGLWKYESDNFINGAPARYKNGVVFGGCDGFLHLVSLRTGELIRKIDLQTYVASSPAIFGNQAYVGDYDGQFFCVDLEAGKIIWTYDNEEKNLPFIASPSIAGEFIVVGNEDRNLYCLNKETGKLVWQKRLSNRINSSSVIAKDKIVTATMDGMLYIHQLRNGEELWKYEIGSQIVSSPAIYDGKIVIGANDGRIYVFGE